MDEGETKSVRKDGFFQLAKKARGGADPATGEQGKKHANKGYPEPWTKITSKSPGGRPEPPLKGNGKVNSSRVLKSTGQKGKKRENQG